MNLPFDAALMAERNRNLVYEEVMRAIEEAAAKEGITKSEIAKRLGKPASQISRWLSGPSNWTLDTVSHLLFAVNAEMDYSAIFHKDRKQSKVRHINSGADAKSIITAPISESGSTSPSVVVEERANHG